MPESLEQRILRYREDFPAYCREVLRIKTKDAVIVPFELKPAQLRLWQLVKDGFDDEEQIRVYVLKARQLGFSTVIKALEFWFVTLWPNRGSLTVSHGMDSAQEMFEKHKLFYAAAPSDFRPERKRSNRKEMKFERDPTDDEVAEAEAAGEEVDVGLRSSLLVQTAKDVNLGRSHTFQYVHASEFAAWEGVGNVKHAMVSLMAAVPKTANTCVFLETTAQGLGYAKDFWDAPDNGYYKLFVSWVADPEYRHDDYLRELPNGTEDLDEIPDGPYGNEVDVANYVRSELAEWWPDTEDVEHEVLCRLAWRRYSIRVDHQGDLDLFQQEYPIHAQEAFLTSGDHVFDTRRLFDYKAALYEEGGLRLIDEPQRYRLNKLKRSFDAAKYGPLKVYREPQKGRRYVIGADPSEGVGHGDAAAAVVLSLPDLEQVAVFHAGYRRHEETQSPVDPDDFADVLNALGRYYNGAHIAVEVNGPGFATNLKLMKTLMYPFLYRRAQFDNSPTCAPPCATR
ncbi:MAG: hypothetical protein ACYTKD_29120 [Planctomycetota bacterium]|jgi:hypothetical protein